MSSITEPSQTTFGDYLRFHPYLAGTVLLACLGLYAFYRFLLLPKPLPKIPYNKEAASRILGDLPALRSHPDGLAEWCSQQLTKLQSPVCQALMGPEFLQKPIVLVADVGEARDALLGSSDFDRSSYIIQRFPLFGDFHLNMKTTDDWRLARQWSKDLLTPKYLDEVATPAIDLATRRLIDLWEAKGQLAAGHAWDMDRDVKGYNIDIILAFYFSGDMNDSILAREVEHKRGLTDAALKPGDFDTVVFPRAPLHAFCEGLIDISHKIASLYATPWPPALAAWWTRRVSPHFRRSFAQKEAFVRHLLSNAVRRAVGNEDQLQTGLDHMVWREGKAAAKGGRKPKYLSQVMVDETYGALVAGQHTTSAAVVWILKYLTDYPEMQQRVRDEVYAACPAAQHEHRLPTADEIVSSLKHLPYLRAVIEETLRLRQAMLIPRDATCDTILMGCPIPKGTVMLLVCQGADPAALRTVDGKPVHAPRQYPGAAPEDMQTFDPERWLVQRRPGAPLEFDGTTYPQLAFGAGVRACWGRKLADREMQVALGMLVCRFDFLPVPEPLATHRATYDISYRANRAFLNVRSREL